MTRRIVLAALAAASVMMGCGGGGDDAPTTGAVYFKIDAATCRGTSANMNLFINGTQVGNEVITVGGTSKAYSVGAGSVVLSAQEVGGFTWVPKTYTVPAGGSFTLLLTC